MNYLQSLFHDLQHNVADVQAATMYTIFKQHHIGHQNIVLKIQNSYEYQEANV
jgi:hypothetical protein